MKALALALALAAGGFVFGAILLSRLGGLPGGPADVLSAILSDALPTSKSLLKVIAGYVVLSLVLEAVSLSLRRPGYSSGSAILALFPPLLAAAYSAYLLLVLGLGALRRHATDFGSLAPGLSEVAVLIGLGLLAGAVTALPSALTSGRRIPWRET